jgi:hypothetical protein
MLRGLILVRCGSSRISQSRSKKIRPVEPIRQEFSPSRMSDPNSTDDARRGGILRRRSEVGNEGGAEPPTPGGGGNRRGALNLLISNNH